MSLDSSSNSLSLSLFICLSLSGMQELGLAGIQIGTSVNDWNLDAEELRPVFRVSAIIILILPLFLIAPHISRLALSSSLPISLLLSVSRLLLSSTPLSLSTRGACRTLGG